MGSKKTKNVRKIEVPTDTHTEFELGDTAADIQGRGGRGRKPGGRKLHSHRWSRQWPKLPRTEKSESEMDPEGGGEASTSIECQFRHKTGHMTNIYLTDSDEEAILDFVKDHAALRQNPQKVQGQGQEGLPLGKIHKQLQVCKIWFESQRRPASALRQHTSHPSAALPAHCSVPAFISRPAGHGSNLPT